MRNTTLPTHPRIRDPRTGEPLRALAIIGGRPVWPVMGASGPIPSGGQPSAVPTAPGTPPATPPATGAQPPGQTPAPGATPPSDDDALGEAGKQTLVKVRKLQAEAETRAATAEKELAELKAATQTDQEKAVEAARAEGISSGNTRLVRAEIKAAAAAAGFHDPVDAAVQLRERLAEIKVSKDGDVDETKVKELVAELAKNKTYLVKAAGPPPPAPLPGQGNHPPAPKSGADAGRAEAERRFGKKTTQS